jgi:hypothetical protein
MSVLAKGSDRGVTTSRNLGERIEAEVSTGWHLSPALSRSQTAQIIQSFDVAIAVPQPQPLLPDNRPPNPSDRLLAVGRGTDLGTWWPARHPPAAVGFGPDGVGVVLHGATVERGSDDLSRMQAEVGSATPWDRQLVDQDDRSR